MRSVICSQNRLSGGARDAENVSKVPFRPLPVFINGQGVARNLADVYTRCARSFAVKIDAQGAPETQKTRQNAISATSGFHEWSKGSPQPGKCVYKVRSVICSQNRRPGGARDAKNASKMPFRPLPVFITGNGKKRQDFYGNMGAWSPREWARASSRTLRKSYEGLVLAQCWDLWGRHHLSGGG